MRGIGGDEKNLTFSIFAIFICGFGYYITLKIC